MGGLLRAKIETNAGDELWEKVRQFMDEGKLIIDVSSYSFFCKFC